MTPTTWVIRAVKLKPETAANMRVYLPSAAARQLPNACEFELSVAEDGFHLRYLREVTRSTSKHGDSTDLPFLPKEKP